MLMLEKLLNQEVKKNVVKLVAIPSNKGADGHQFLNIREKYHLNYLVQILTGPVSKTREITSNANEKIRLGRESSFCNHLLS
jgi:hypothetical protein